MENPLTKPEILAFLTKFAKELQSFLKDFEKKHGKKLTKTEVKACFTTTLRILGNDSMKWCKQVVEEASTKK